MWLSEEVDAGIEIKHKVDLRRRAWNFFLLMLHGLWRMVEPFFDEE